MRYGSVREGIFLERPNRFIAHVLINGEKQICHVKNTGRCRELLIPGVKVYLVPGANPLRKTPFDLIAVEKHLPSGETRLINMDSQIPNDCAEEFLRKGDLFPEGSEIRREVRYGASRFDFQITTPEGKICYMEVKGVTLEQENTALFPDAPTERGVKHLLELIQCVKAGFEARILFVIQMKGIKLFRPNSVMHREFAETLRLAERSGVCLHAIDCLVTPESITLDSLVPIDTTLPEDTF